MKLPSFALLAVLALAACDSPIDPLSDPNTFEGVVLEKDDQTPLDGPVYITVRRDNGEIVTVVSPSLFTTADQFERAAALYEQARRADPGRRIRVRGERRGDRVFAEAITILD